MLVGGRGVSDFGFRKSRQISSFNNEEIDLAKANNSGYISARAVL